MDIERNNFIATFYLSDFLSVIMFLNIDRYSKHNVIKNRIFFRNIEI